MTFDATREATDLIPREYARKRRHECGAQCTFGKQVSKDVRKAERDAEGVHRIAGAEEIREHLIAHDAEHAARHRRNADGSGRSDEALLRQWAPGLKTPPYGWSLRRTNSLTIFPSTVLPASSAITAFMTFPMSLADDALVAAIAASIVRSSSAGSSAGGR